MRYFILFLSVFLFASCDSLKNKYEDKDKNKVVKIFGETQPPRVCNQDNRKIFVYKVMHDSYLWANETPSFTKEKILNFKDDKELLKALIVPSDKFSYIMKKEVHNNYFQAGVNVGFGFYPSLIDNGTNVNIDFVYPNSPAEKAGLKRGDVIVAIDGYDIMQIRSSQVLLDKYFGPQEKNNRVFLKLQDSKEIYITSGEFKINTVLYSNIFEQGEKTVGYFVFQNFIGTASNDINRVFKEFKKENVNELILDLRYNGGGYLSIAKELVSLIGGDRVNGNIFNKVYFNQKYSNYNYVEYIEKTSPNSLNLSRVFIITTSSSCSASELVINALKASSNNIEVIQVGSSTCGKPYGMLGGAYCDNYILPVQMENVNGDGEGAYVDGIAPMCESIDDISLDFGDIYAPSLKAALFYINNDRCEIKNIRAVTKEREEILDGFGRMYGVF